MSIGSTLSGTGLRFGLLYNQIQRDDEEQQLLDSYVKTSVEARPISTRRLNQQRTREAALVDAQQGNSAALDARPPSLASLALDVFARNFPRLLRITQAGDGEASVDSVTNGKEATSSTPAAASAAKAVTSSLGKRKSSRVAASNSGRNGQGTPATRFMDPDGRPSKEISQRTHESLRLLPPQHLAALQQLLEKYHRHALTVLTLRRYFLPPINTRCNLSPAIPIITMSPNQGPIQLLTAATAHARTLTHASLVALNRLDAKHFLKFSAQATRLEYLDLSACVNFNASCLRALVNACKDEGRGSRLRYLNLDATAVGAQGVAAAIAAFHQLEVLKLANVQGLDDEILANAIVSAISESADEARSAQAEQMASTPLYRLTSLKVRRTVVGDESLALILGMCDPSLFRTLDIGFSRCTLEGLLDAIKAPPQSSQLEGGHAESKVIDSVRGVDEVQRSRTGSPALQTSLSSQPTASSNLGIHAHPPAPVGPTTSQASSEISAPPPFAAKFNLHKLNISGLNLYNHRGPPETRLRPLRNLLDSQPELHSLYLQRVPHFGRNYDLVQELVGVLREGLERILQARSRANAGTVGPASPAVPLLRKLVLSDNPALGYRVVESRLRPGWYFAHQVSEHEEAEAGELARLMKSIGVYCEEIRLCNVSLLTHHLALSPYQRVLELDHTGIEDGTILDALERAGMIPAGQVIEVPPPELGSSSFSKTRSGRTVSPPVSREIRAERRGKAKLKAAEAEHTLVVGNLRRISLVDAKVSDTSLRPLLECNPYLQELDITSCRSVPVVQRRNYFEHIFGDELQEDDDDDLEHTTSEADSYETRQRRSKLNPHRSNSDRRAAVARRQAASGTTLTRQEMVDDDFVMDSDSDYDDGSSRVRKRASTSSPRKRASTASSSKRAGTGKSPSQASRSRGQVESPSKSGRTTRQAAAATAAASSRPSGTASQLSRGRAASRRAPITGGSQRRRPSVALDSTEESDELEASETPTEEGEDEDYSEADDDKPLAQRKRRRVRSAAAAANPVRSSSRVSAQRTRPPKRSAARNLSLVDRVEVDDDEDDDPDFDMGS